MKNVLVFPCGSEIGLEVNRALAYSLHFNLFGGSSVSDHGKFTYKNYIGDIPDINDLDFINKFNNIIDMFNIDFIIPAHDSVVVKLAENQLLLKATVVTSPYETCLVCRSKRKTYEIFKNIIPTPELYEKDYAKFPVFLKPDIGQGSKGTYLANTKEEAEIFTSKDPTLLWLEYLPGKEYTVDCFTDRKKRLLFVGGRERKRICNGISVNSIPVQKLEFRKIAEKINSILEFRGVWFFQVKERSNGELVLMEIAPRIAGTMGLFRIRGINLVQLSLFDRMGIDVEILDNKFEIEIDRALYSSFSIGIDYDWVYVDLDDTLIINDKINPEVIKFLYQAKNHGKHICLLTKHKRDIKTTLSSYAISDKLFDEIIVLKDTEKKADFIRTTKAILIDDSFSERKTVHEILKIPVFGLDGIEGLLDCRL
ncbi:MAG: ATP-grasp domain-containing protein [Chitinispirillaceae bacterium]|nr:ATP-grasp domain-containing protein [Chitinispirillaceae bacterium]